MDVRGLKLATGAGLYLAGLALLFFLAVRNFMGGSPPSTTGQWAVPSPKLAQIGGLARLQSTNQAPFESGNIGKIERRGSRQIVLNLRSDNDDALPKYWRQWFYLSLDRLPTKQSVEITVVGAGQWNYYLPFYSYDNVTWIQFEQKAVTKPTRHTLKIRHQFKQSKVWIARYVPYTYSKLNTYLNKVKDKPFVSLSDIGSTPEGRKIPLVTITNARSRQQKSRVLIHARTHPGEVGSSFLLEGLIDYLLGSSAKARQLRDQVVFSIVPMLNVDGVVAGNNRVTPRGVNLEGKWYADSNDAVSLDTSRVPAEVQLLHALAEKLAHDSLPVRVALNLHSSAGEPEDNVFFFPHFGPAAKGYSRAEANLYGSQRRFIALFCGAQGPEWFNQPPADGTRAFLAKSIPETWWWRNFKDDVMAMTIESSYGFAGGQKRWIKPRDMRRMGASLAQAILSYQNSPTLRRRDLAH